jgi:hypothetical protein
LLMLNATQYKWSKKCKRCVEEEESDEPKVPAE